MQTGGQQWVKLVQWTLTSRNAFMSFCPSAFSPLISSQWETKVHHQIYKLNRAPALLKLFSLGSHSPPVTSTTSLLLQVWLMMAVTQVCWLFLKNLELLTFYYCLYMSYNGLSQFPNCFNMNLKNTGLFLLPHWLQMIIHSAGEEYEQIFWCFLKMCWQKLCRKSLSLCHANLWPLLGI